MKRVLHLGSALAACLLFGDLVAQTTFTKSSPSTTTRGQAQLASPAVGAAPFVEVFTTASIYLTNASGARVYLLDGLEQLEEELSQGLPSDEATALPVAQRRLVKMGAQALQERAANAAEGLSRAAQYGVDRVPAVVFDGRSVVYGVTDVAEARRLYEQAAAGQKGGRK